MQQITELLSTGGVGARIPIIQRAVEAATAASGQAAQRNREVTARAGLTGSAFDISNQLGHQARSSAAIASIGPQMASQMLAQAPSAIANTVQLGLSAVSSDIRRQSINVANYGAFMNAIRESFTSWYGGGGGGGSTPTADTSGGGPYNLSVDTGGNTGRTLVPVGSTGAGGSYLGYGG
jgi:hypothetical protein